ncbi:hypothetical protein [Campylobacter lanienae]|nr:hypothetical protein [Campylobacter lanienae]MDY6135215.1 hypothetical protein [Campylobacter lanienae]
MDNKFDKSVRSTAMGYPACGALVRGQADGACRKAGLSSAAK